MMKAMNAINAEAPVRVSVPKVVEHKKSIIEGNKLRIMQPTGRSTKRYEAGTSASAVEHNASFISN